MPDIELSASFQVCYADNGFVVRAWLPLQGPDPDDPDGYCLGQTKTYVCGTDLEVRDLLDKVLFNISKRDDRRIEDETGLRVNF